MKRLQSGLVRGALAAAGVTAALFAAGASTAQTAGGPFGSGNAPIDISADELEVRDTEGRAIWRGSVEAIQGQNRMRAPSLSIYYASRAGQPANSAMAGDIQRMEAEGPVYYVTPQQNARGDRAVYEAGTSTITLTGNVVLVQDRNVVRGDRLTIDTRTNQATLVSNPQSGRVRGVFYPNQSQAGTGATQP